MINAANQRRGADQAATNPIRSKLLTDRNRIAKRGELPVELVAEIN